MTEQVIWSASTRAITAVVPRCGATAVLSVSIELPHRIPAQAHHGDLSGSRTAVDERSIAKPMRTDAVGRTAPDTAAAR